MKTKWGISGSVLKWFAVITMVIDHFGASVLETYVMNVWGRSPLGNLFSDHWNELLRVDRILRYIGRPAFPIFCFLLVEGFLHTKNVWKYAGRLALFALVSEIPFDLAFQGEWLFMGYQNIFFTLLIGLLVMIAFQTAEEKMAAKPLRILCEAVVLLAGYVLADVMHTDYGGLGVVCIMLLYIFRYNRKMQVLAGAAVFMWEITAPLAFLPIYFYNGKRGMKMKYFFYAFYPVHLLILYGIAWLLGVA